MAVVLCVWYVLLGLQTALPLLMEGKQLSVEKAQSLGLIHDLAENETELTQQSPRLDSSTSTITTTYLMSKAIKSRGERHPKRLLSRKCCPLLLPCYATKPKAVTLRLKQS